MGRTWAIEAEPGARFHLANHSTLEDTSGASNYRSSSLVLRRQGKKKSLSLSKRYLWGRSDSHPCQCRKPRGRRGSKSDEVGWTPENKETRRSTPASFIFKNTPSTLMHCFCFVSPRHTWQFNAPKCQEGKLQRGLEHRTTVSIFAT